MKTTEILDPLYVRPLQLTKMYSLSRSTIWKLVNEMQEIPQYRKSVICLNPKLRLIKADAFEAYLQSKNYKYLKE